MKNWKIIAQLKTGQIKKVESVSLSEALENLKTAEWKRLVVKNF